MHAILAIAIALGLAPRGVVLNIIASDVRIILYVSRYAQIKSTRGYFVEVVEKVEMASAGRNKDVRTVLTRLTKSFYQLMSADIRIDLFGKDIFTWSENEAIG